MVFYNRSVLVKVSVQYSLICDLLQKKTRKLNEVVADLGTASVGKHYSGHLSSSYFVRS